MKDTRIAIIKDLAGRGCTCGYIGEAKIPVDRRCLSCRARAVLKPKRKKPKKDPRQLELV